MDRMLRRSCCGDSSKRKQRQRSPRRQAASRKWAARLVFPVPARARDEDGAAAVVPLAAEHRRRDAATPGRHALQRSVVLQRHRGHRQHADAVGIDEERVLVGAVVRTAVLDDTQAARRDLIVDAMVEQDHRVRHVLLEALPGQQAFATLARDHGGDAPVFQPPEQPTQFAIGGWPRPSSPANSDSMVSRTTRLAPTDWIA